MFISILLITGWSILLAVIMWGILIRNRKLAYISSHIPKNLLVKYQTDLTTVDAMSYQIKRFIPDITVCISINIVFVLLVAGNSEIEWWHIILAVLANTGIISSSFSIIPIYSYSRQLEDQILIDFENEAD